MHIALRYQSQILLVDESLAGQEITDPVTGDTILVPKDGPRVPSPSEWQSDGLDSVHSAQTKIQTVSEKIKPTPEQEMVRTGIIDDDVEDADVDDNSGLLDDAPPPALYDDEPAPIPYAGNVQEDAIDDMPTVTYEDDMGETVSSPTENDDSASLAAEAEPQISPKKDAAQEPAHAGEEPQDAPEEDVEYEEEVVYEEEVEYIDEEDFVEGEEEEGVEYEYEYEYVDEEDPEGEYEDEAATGAPQKRPVEDNLNEDEHTGQAVAYADDKQPFEEEYEEELVPEAPPPRRKGSGSRRSKAGKAGGSRRSVAGGSRRSKAQSSEKKKKGCMGMVLLTVSGAIAVAYAAGQLIMQII